MEYRQLGRTGLFVSPLTLGSMLYGTATDQAEVDRQVAKALEVGINSFDTANIYGKGKSEEALGKALKAQVDRDRIVLASKVHVSMDDSDPNARGNSRKHILQQVHASLKRLGTDHLDIYYIHRPSTTVPIDETLRALDDLIRLGMVRYIGTSSYAAWQVLESLWVSKELGLNRFVVEQSPYHLLDRSIERELLPMAQTYGLGVLAWSPLAGGFLTGKYRREQVRPEGSRFAELNGDWNRKHFIPQAFDVLEGLLPIAEELGCSLAQLTLAWCISQPGMTGAVIGAKSMEQLQEQLGALDLRLTPEIQARINQVAVPARTVVPYYLEDGFKDLRPHQYRW
ncbi:aldo/keto reductase [Deinococcus cellulosilyticus]|uniref:Aldo/keto reductase n=1 Tax=Deinococcus cellulosilyticus (strain DSM 18568 / NBRC 106333 / KACC 11606 / 5516J-15) TaxID=1223518 RepID=A0A511N9E7_DEIC1|nr:aldo/keto reductase [Deinococcus cellulosilyticus]GEM49420.1 aldo/keto reductase [Deinococcus cellulosilyticus NBRC 106333 = KACC 11606]